MNDSSATPPRDVTDVSVVVCTYNRARQIERALVHVEEAAKRANLSVEIVVVDNNSRDDTKTVVASAARASAIPIRYIFESQQGLSFARNCGVKASKGSIIAFTDDDCIVDASWIDALWRTFAANPDVAVLGGRVELYAREDQPISIRPIAECVRYTNAGQIYGLIIGCNMAVRRGAADRIGGFDPALGGSKGVAAEDIEFIYRALKQGLGILYTPEPLVRHNHGRRTAEDVRAVARNYVRGRGAFFCKYLLNADRTILRHAWWEIRARRRFGPGDANQLSRRETLGALASGALHFILTRMGLVCP